MSVYLCKTVCSAFEWTLTEFWRHINLRVVIVVRGWPIIAAFQS